MSSLAFLKEGGYPIQLTISWAAEFQANGSGFQALPDLVHTYSARHQVRQVQAVVTR